MRAIVIDQFGPPEVLQLRQLPEPSPGDGEVLVRVRAAEAHAIGEGGHVRGRLVLDAS